MPSSEKSNLRKRVLALRDALGSDERGELSARITSRLIALAEYCAAHRVMAYVSFGAEFDTSAFIADLRAAGKQLILPRVDRDARALKLYMVGDLDRELVPGIWGIREPQLDVCPEVTPAMVDFVLVPGVAFTARCERLGYGGGFYDRLIRRFEKRPALIAAAFAVQVVPEIPLTPSDELIDGVVTEDAEYRRAGEDRA